MTFKLAELFTTFTKDKADKIDFRRNKTLNKAAVDSKSKQQQNPPIQFNIFERVERQQQSAKEDNNLSGDKFKAASDLKQLFSIALVSVLTKSDPLQIAELIQNNYDPTYISKHFSDEVSFLPSILKFASDNLIQLQEDTARNAKKWLSKDYFWIYFYDKYSASEHLTAIGYVHLPKLTVQKIPKFVGYSYNFDIYNTLEFLYAVTVLYFSERLKYTERLKTFGLSYLPKHKIQRAYRLFGRFNGIEDLRERFNRILTCLIPVGYIRYIHQIQRLYKIAQYLVNRTTLHSSAGDSKSTKDKADGQLKKESSSSTDTAYVSKGSKSAEKTQSTGKQAQTNSSEHQSNISAAGNKSKETNKDVGTLQQTNNSSYTNNNSASGSKSKTSKTSASSATDSAASQYSNNNQSSGTSKTAKATSADKLQDSSSDSYIDNNRSIGNTRTSKTYNSASLQDTNKDSIIQSHSAGYSKTEDRTTDGKYTTNKRSILVDSNYAVGDKYKEEIITSAVYSLCLLYYVARL